MAKLGSYYGLCPLIDQKSLLGISDDATNGCVIVTLGRNMAIKYKLSDQKQIHSWSTKEKLSSPVVYDKKHDRYVAIFNHSFMRIWEAHEKNLEKIKKIKFSVAVHTIVPYEEEPIVIFKNGHVFTLTQALEIRKSIPQVDLIDKNSTIEAQTCLKSNETYVGLFVKTNHLFSYIWMKPNGSRYLKKIDLIRNGFSLNGHLVALTESGPILYTLWSDGRLFTYPLIDTPENLEPPGNFYTVIESLSRQYQVCMVSLNNNYIAMYGADSNQEGATLQIYNTQFKVTQSKHHFKLFSESSKLWLMGSNLLLTVGQNLAVVPFHLNTEQLAALVGSHKLVATTDDEDVAIVTEVLVGNWGTGENNIKSSKKQNMPSKIESQLSSFIREGWAESAICEEIFPMLMQKKDNETILECFEYFSDIPETILVKILSYVFSSFSSSIQNLDVVNKGLPDKCSVLVDKILLKSYSDFLLMPALRSHLKFDDVLLMLEYLCFLLSKSDHAVPPLDIAEYERKIIDWGSLLLDANYQQFLLSKDEKILHNLQLFKGLADEYYQCLTNFNKVEPILSQLQSGKCPSKPTNSISLKYSIEKIILF